MNKNSPVAIIFIFQLHFFHSYYFDRCSSELAQLVPLPFLEGGLLVILIDCMIFLSPFLDVTGMSCTSRLWNSLLIECFPLTYLNGFKSRINRHLLTVGSF